ncbi:MAG: flagellar basal body-associated FliL family protein [Firmicutes bacterium]|nr:flagellar basal body-associated FliL family protein [Bacillota bacterium]
MKNKVMMIAIIVLLVVLLLTICVGFFLTFRHLSTPPEGEAEVTEEVEDAIDKENLLIYTLDESIYTNLLTGNDGKAHVVRVSVSIGIDNSDEEAGAAFMTKIGDQSVIAKDAILSVLRNKTYDELSRAEAQEVLREEILAGLQKEFNTNEIVTVYISDLFVQ